eukprot:2213491-Amphidinium_carterae.1
MVEPKDALWSFRTRFGQIQVGGIEHYRKGDTWFGPVMLVSDLNECRPWRDDHAELHSSHRAPVAPGLHEHLLVASSGEGNGSLE